MHGGLAVVYLHIVHFRGVAFWKALQLLAQHDNLFCHQYKDRFTMTSGNGLVTTYSGPAVSPTEVNIKKDLIAVVFSVLWSGIC